jgi:hypothetical protein
LAAKKHQKKERIDRKKAQNAQKEYGKTIMSFDALNSLVHFCAFCAFLRPILLIFLFRVGFVRPFHPTGLPRIARPIAYH